MDEERAIRHESAELAYEYEMPDGPSLPPLPKFSRRTKLIATVVLIAVALLSFFVVAEFASSPESHSGTIQTLDNKKDTVMGLVGASSASSAAISLLPGDAGTPIAEKLVDLSSDFLIVVAAIYLEKYLITIIGFITFKALVPVSCLLAISVLHVRGYDTLRMGALQIAAKLCVFGVAMYLVVPVSVFVSGMIERTYEASINETIQTAEQTTQKIEQSQAEENKEEQQTDILTTISQIPEAISQIPENLSGLASEAQEALNGFIEALAVMIVTSCVIPLLVLLFFLWLVRVILGVRIDMPAYVRMMYPRSLRRRGHSHAITRR